MCRRLRSLAHSPQLVHSIDVAFGRTNALSRLRAFCSWLLQHAAGAVRHLAVTLHRGKLSGSKLSAEDAAEAAALLAGLVAACGAAGGLEELRLKLNIPFRFSSLMAALRHLKRLDVHIDHAVQVSASLVPLTAMQELSLNGWPLRLLPEARLPASVTKLQLSGDGSEALPPQVTIHLLSHCWMLAWCAHSLPHQAWFLHQGWWGATHSCIPPLSVPNLSCT